MFSGGRFGCETVDGSEILRSQVEGKVVESPFFIGFYICQVVQDFFHQQEENRRQILKRQQLSREGMSFYIVGLLGKNPAKSSVSLCGEQTK